MVWITCAISNGYPLSDQMVCWALHYVYQLCECKYYDIPQSLPKWSLARKKSYRLPIDQMSLLYSINIF